MTRPIDRIINLLCNGAQFSWFIIMRTTISLDDQLADRLRSAAAERGLSVSAFIAQTLEYAQNSRQIAEPPPFKLVTVRGGRVPPGIDLDRPRLLESLDDESCCADDSR